MLKKYKVQVRVVMWALQSVEVTANSELEAIDKAEDELLDWDIDEFVNTEIEETEVQHVQLIGEVAA